MGRRDSRLVDVGGSLCTAASRGGSTARQELASTTSRSSQDPRPEHATQVPQTANVFQPAESRLECWT